MQLKQYELSLLYLFNARNIPQKWSVDSHCLYLHSCILKEQKKYIEALEELAQINTSDPLGSLAMYKICEICDEIKSTAFGSSNVSLTSAKNTVKLQSVLIDLHLKSLKMLVKVSTTFVLNTILLLKFVLHLIQFCCYAKCIMNNQ